MKRRKFGMRKLFAIIVVALSMLFMAAVAQAEDMPAMAGDPGSASCNCPMMKDGGMMGKGIQAFQAPFSRYSAAPAC